MSENEYLENEEEVADDLSQDEYQEDENLINEEEESDEDEPQKESFVQKLRRENKELKKQLKTQKTSETPLDTELRLFFLENPEYKDMKEEMLAVKNEHPTLTLQQAYKLAKDEKPKESHSRKESFEWWAYKPKPKTLETMSDAEAENLPPADYLKRLKLRWELK